MHKSNNAWSEDGNTVVNRPAKPRLVEFPAKHHRFFFHFVVCFQSLKGKVMKKKKPFFFAMKMGNSPLLYMRLSYFNLFLFLKNKKLGTIS